jgi:hypothetical protein
MKNSNDTIRNRTRDVPACSAVSQPTAPPRAPHVIEGKREVTGRSGRRHVKLLDDLKKMRGYWILKYETLGRTVWKIRSRRGYGTGTRNKTQ